MAKTEVILISNIVGLGAESDQVTVAAGYARNYLFPRGLAIPLTMANKKRIEALKKRRAEREAQELNTRYTGLPVCSFESFDISERRCAALASAFSRSVLASSRSCSVMA